MCIADRSHAGLLLDERRWVPVGAAVLVLAALLRAGASWSGLDSLALLGVAGLLWDAVFVLYAWHRVPVLVSARQDAGSCREGVMRLHRRQHNFVCSYSLYSCKCL